MSGPVTAGKANALEPAEGSFVPTVGPRSPRARPARSASSRCDAPCHAAPAA